jgi:type I restriction enzyme R subunit
MGFDLETLRDIYGEPEADLKDFIDVALGKKTFPTLKERKRKNLKQWLIEKKKDPRRRRKFHLDICGFQK